MLLRPTICASRGLPLSASTRRTSQLAVPTAGGRPIAARAAAGTMAPASQDVLAAGSTQPILGTREAPTFITTWNCPYAQRTWIALNEKGVDFKPVFVDLRSKPEWFFPLNPKGQVPTLAWQEPDGPQSLYESLVCNEYVQEGFQGPGLLPDNPVARSKVRLLIDQFGQKFAPALVKVMFASEADSEAAKKGLDEAVAWLDSALDPQGPYAAGAAFTLADAALAPFALRLPVLEGLAGYETPASAKRVAAWTAALLERPSVQASMAPPDPKRTYQEQLLDTYKDYVAARKAATTA